jgi:hypothetical protein
MSVALDVVLCDAADARVSPVAPVAVTLAVAIVDPVEDLPVAAAVNLDFSTVAVAVTIDTAIDLALCRARCCIFLMASCGEVFAVTMVLASKCLLLFDNSVPDNGLIPFFEPEAVLVVGMMFLR